MKKLGFTSIVAVAALSIGLPAATASAVYPPDAPPAPAAPPAPPAPGGGLPQTGGDSFRTVQAATGLVAVGAGLTLVGGLRRRKSATL